MDDISMAHELDQKRQLEPSEAFPNRVLLLNGGERNGGYATFVWQERAQTRATQMTHMRCLKPLRLLCHNEGSLRHRRVICLSQKGNVAPI